MVERSDASALRIGAASLAARQLFFQSDQRYAPYGSFLRRWVPVAMGGMRYHFVGFEQQYPSPGRRVQSVSPQPYLLFFESSLAHFLFNFPFL